MSTRRLLRLPPLALAAAIATFSISAQAQWGGLLQSLMQTQSNVAQQKAAEEAAVAAALPPAKRWGNTKPVPAELQQQAQAFAARVPEAELRPLYERLYIEGERNATLNFKRIGLAALAAGHLDTAEKALDAATLRIDQIYADNPEAQKAKSLWVAEKVKDFKGEPYERAMAYYYRGLVYSARNDFQNARAMFKQADYQDTVAEAEQYAGDFALMPYMAGWASYCDGNASLAKDYHQMAVKGDPSYAAISVEQPVLLLLETGRAPFKYGAGKHAEQLKWQSHALPKQTVKSACTAQGGDCVQSSFVAGADIGFQATTRGGRPIDSVLNGKASFKEGAQNVADVANTVGAVGLGVALGAGNSDAAGLGLLGMFAGMVAQSVAASTQTQADIREWEQLPDTIWLATAPTKLDSELSAQLTAGEAPATHAGFTRLANAPSCQLYWGRSESPLSTAAEAGPIEPGENPRDPAFRKDLESQLGTQVAG
jgi:tetratricopeptide (TPR) repeat protein